MTPIDIKWLLAHGFERLGGMRPVGCGDSYRISLARSESIIIDVPNPQEYENAIAIDISGTPDTYGPKPMHMVVHTKYCDSEIHKKQYIPDGNGGWIANPFYVEELFTLLDLTDNGDMKEFFIN